MEEVQKHQDWLIKDFWEANVLPAIQNATIGSQKFQSGASAFQGGFIDAQNTNQSLLTRQELTANAQREHAVSEQVCRFGSLSRSLSASETEAARRQMNLVTASFDRQLLKPSEKSSEGIAMDLSSRYDRFKSKFCDQKAYASGFSFCSKDDTLTNLDIDYTRLVDTQGTLSPAEEAAVIPMMQNLFANRTFEKIDPNLLKPSATGNTARDALLDQRALIAKRSVAENSFQALVSRRMQGTSGSRESIKALLKNMGIKEDSDIIREITDKPSYNTQMEILTKRVYQDADFFKNLMENPTNLARQYTAMQSFGLMQQRDIYDSIQRSELLLSLVVEMELEKFQDEVTRSAR
jgi:hypothetical protein